MTNSDGSCPTCHTRLEDDGTCAQPHEPVRGVLTGQYLVGAYSDEIAMMPDKDDTDGSQ